ncbi:phosphoglycerate mutase family protein [Pseudomonas fragi]|uniref:Phosphoglycerate mutase family protein n=1 Tax=Pseudomonas fragi TaxID=296 RepID=A0A449IEC5_PSEFR|nr:phosphoglycerate mutase family protein [Pseudomonas fragi]
MDTTRRVPGRAYQTVRDPKRLLIEERAEALSAAGYPLPDDDPAMYAEQRLLEAKEAAKNRPLSSFSAT